MKKYPAKPRDIMKATNKTTVTISWAKLIASIQLLKICFVIFVSIFKYRKYVFTCMYPDSHKCIQYYIQLQILSTYICMFFHPNISEAFRFPQFELLQYIPTWHSNWYNRNYTCQHWKSVNGKNGVHYYFAYTISFLIIHVFGVRPLKYYVNSLKLLEKKTASSCNQCRKLHDQILMA